MSFYHSGAFVVRFFKDFISIYYGTVLFRKTLYRFIYFADCGTRIVCQKCKVDMNEIFKSSKKHACESELVKETQEGAVGGQGTMASNTKGQLISEEYFLVFKYSKNQTDFFYRFCPKGQVNSE